MLIRVLLASGPEIFSPSTFTIDTTVDLTARIIGPSRTLELPLLVRSGFFSFFFLSQWWAAKVIFLWAFSP